MISFGTVANVAWDAASHYQIIAASLFDFMDICNAISDDYNRDLSRTPVPSQCPTNRRAWNRTKTLPITVLLPSCNRVTYSSHTSATHRPIYSYHPASSLSEVCWSDHQEDIRRSAECMQRRHTLKQQVFDICLTALGKAMKPWGAASYTLE